MASLGGRIWVTTVTVLAQTPQFRAGVDVVHLDVSVYDKAGNPVRGLTAADFTLLEDDKPRPIVAFSAVDIPAAPPPTAAWMRDAPIDVATNDIKDRRLFLIVIDDANYASFGGLTLVESLKSAARAFIAHLAPTDLAAVVFTGDNRRSQDFTTDRARLIAAVNQTSAPGMDCRLSATYSVEVLRRATDLIIGAPGPRKALVMFTDFDQNMAVVPDSQEMLQPQLRHRSVVRALRVGATRRRECLHVEAEVRLAGARRQLGRPMDSPHSARDRGRGVLRCARSSRR